MAHTPDPLWLTETPRPCGCVLVLSRAGQDIRECPTHAAAPEMLAVIQRFATMYQPDGMRYVFSESEQPGDVFRVARALLAKIDGGTRG